jgi:hypothetical protein
VGAVAGHRTVRGRVSSNGKGAIRLDSRPLLAGMCVGHRSSSPAATRGCRPSRSGSCPAWSNARWIAQSPGSGAEWLRSGRGVGGAVRGPDRRTQAADNSVDPLEPTCDPATRAAKSARDEDPRGATSSASHARLLRRSIVADHHVAASFVCVAINVCRISKRTKR